MSNTDSNDFNAAQAADLASDLRELRKTGVNADAPPQLLISKELQALMERGLHSTRLPQEMRTAKAAEAFQQAFEVIGGVPRLALWADQNPDKFYMLYGRMITPTINPVLPEANKGQVIDNMPWITAQRHQYKLARVSAEDAKLKNE